MEIKRIEKLNLDECKLYLQHNLNALIASEVQNRLNAILNEQYNSNKETASDVPTRQNANFNGDKMSFQNEKKAEVHKNKDSVTLKNKWIDINQFLEDNRRYKNLRVIRILLLSILSIFMFLLLAVTYYINTEHTKYDIQLDHVYGLEYVLYFMGLIRGPYYYHGDYHYGDGGVSIFLMIVSISLIFLYLVLAFFHSSLIGKIYNIEDGSKNELFRPIQNSQGKSGLCKLGKTRIKQLLPFQYDLVCPAKNDSFFCYRDSLYGLYNASCRKMVIPVEYNEIYSMDESSITLAKNGVLFTFSYKGYRIIK